MIDRHGSSTDGALFSSDSPATRADGHGRRSPGAAMPGRMMLLTMTAVFVTEAAIMAFLALLPPLTTWMEAIVDATLLSVLVFPALYLAIFRPLIRQIEQRERAETELEASRSLLAEAQRVAHVGHWVWEIESDVVQWSDETCRVFGLAPGEGPPSYQAFLERVHPADRDHVREVVGSAVSEGRGYTLEHRILPGDGVEKTVHSKAEVVLSNDGRALRVIGVIQDITERRQVQQALEEAYQELDLRVHERTSELAVANEALRRERNFVDAVIDTAGALVVVLDREGNVVRFNKACERVSGFSADEVRGRAFWELVIPAEERDGVGSTFRALCAGDFPSLYQNHWMTSSGDRRFISWANTVICDDAGAVDYVIGTGVDITEQRQAEEQLRFSEERYRTVLRTAQDGFWAVDGEGRLVDVNDAYCRMTGYRRDELVGQHISLVEVNENEAAVAEHVKRLAESGHDRFETRHRCKDRRLIDVEVSATHLPFGAGQFFAFLRDVTERRRAAAELARSRAEFEAIINSNADAIVFTDTDHRIALVNPAFTRMFGFSADEVRNRTTHFLDVVPRPDEAHGSAGSRSSGSSPSPFEVECLRKDGSTLWVETQAVEVRDRDGSLLGHVGVHRDVSQRRQAEAQIRASLREKEVLLKEIHHRVKNNLQVIASMLNLQADNLHDERALAPLRESQNRIRSLALVHEKLYRSRDLAHIDFADYVRDLASSVVASVSRSSTAVEVEVEVDDVTFGIDTAIPVALIVNELVSNSVKHAFANRPTGRIAIDLRRLEKERHLLVVEDDGVGLPEQLDPSSLHTLGLQLVEVLAMQLDGELRFGGDAGARFEIEFSRIANGRNAP